MTETLKSRICNTCGKGFTVALRAGICKPCALLAQLNLGMRHDAEARVLMWMESESQKRPDAAPTLMDLANWRIAYLRGLITEAQFRDTWPDVEPEL